MAFGFFAVQCSCRPYRQTIDNVLKAVAEAELFLTLFISVVLRTNLGKEALTAESYGGLLVANFLAAPTVEALYLIGAVVRYCRSKKVEPTLDKYGANPSEKVASLAPVESSAGRDTVVEINTQRDTPSKEATSSTYDPKAGKQLLQSQEEVKTLPDLVSSHSREPREP